MRIYYEFEEAITVWHHKACRVMTNDDPKGRNMGLHGALSSIPFTVKPVLKSHSKRRPKLVFKTNYHLMQVKSIAECSKRVFCNTFNLHLATICR